jgi:hypothetical protein
LIVIALVLPAGEASAGCGDLDLGCQIKALDAELGVTKTAISALNTTVGFLNQQVAALATAVEAVEDTFNDLSEDVLHFVTVFATTIDSLSAEAMTFSQDMIQRTEQSAELFRFFLAYERDKFLAFVGTDGCSAECEKFRGQIIELVTHIETTTNLAFEAALVQITLDSGQRPPSLPGLDLTLVKDLLRAAPGVTLYPLHRALALVTTDSMSPEIPSFCQADDPGCAIDFLNGLLQNVEDTLSALTSLADASTPASSPYARRTSAGTMENVCVNWIAGDVLGVNKAQVLERGADVLIISSGLLRSVGHLLDAIGLAGVTSKDFTVGGSFAIQAGFGVRIEKARKFGKKAAMVSQLLYEIGLFTEAKLAECRARLNNAVMQCWLSVKNPVPGNNNKDSTMERCVKEVKNGTWSYAP